MNQINPNKCHSTLTIKNADFYCNQCNLFLSKYEVEEIKHEKGIEYICKKGRSKCLRIEDYKYNNKCKVYSKLADNFWLQLPLIFIKPFNRQGLRMMFQGCIGFSIVNYLMLFGPVGLIGAGPLLVLYIAACIHSFVDYYSISQAKGHPGWPDLFNMDWFLNSIFIVVAAILCFSIGFFIDDKYSQGEILFPWYYYPELIVFPMLVLSISLLGEINAFDPIKILSSIGFVGLPYLVVIAVWIIFIYYIKIMFLDYILFFTNITSGKIIIKLAQTIPISLIKWFVFTYLLLVSTQILGLLYRGNKKWLLWLE